ncbi:hypothetical protein ACZ90_27840 [Streptomyces albus subsp. albus]|nr:hypothetical protein ACZ90_27840 [Streptomyces albus subsp. albus]
MVVPARGSRRRVDVRQLSGTEFCANREPAGVDVIGEVDHDAFGIHAEGRSDELGIEGVDQVGESSTPQGPRWDTAGVQEVADMGG